MRKIERGEIPFDDIASGMPAGQGGQPRRPLEAGHPQALAPQPEQIPPRSAAHIQNTLARTQMPDKRLQKGRRIDAGRRLEIRLIVMAVIIHMEESVFNNPQPTGAGRRSRGSGSDSQPGCAGDPQEARTPTCPPKAD